MADTPSISYFHRILSTEVELLLNSSTELTLFLPEDSAWDALPPIERLYLESEFASDDLHRIYDMHAVAHDSVHWSEAFKPAINRQSPFVAALAISMTERAHSDYH